MKFKEWKIRKNLSSEEWDYVLQQKHKRGKLGKASQITFNGVQIPRWRVQKAESRKTLSSLKALRSGIAS
jgi:hypothetical protein